MGRIYLPITGSPEGKKAIVKVMEIAHNWNMEVVAISILDQELINKLERYKIFLEEESSIFKDTMHKDAEKYLQYVKKVAESKGVKISEVLLIGEPYKAIMDYLKSEPDADKFIFIAKKSGGEYMKDIFSVVERKILLSAPYNIIVVGDHV